MNCEATKDCPCAKCADRRYGHTMPSDRPHESFLAYLAFIYAGLSDTEALQRIEKKGH